MTMKRLLRCGSAACGLLLFSSLAHAEVRLGAYGGPTFYTQVESPADEEFDTGNRTGIAAGLVLDLGAGGRLWVRLAPGWVEKGATFGFELFGDAVEGRFKLGYVELPLTLNVSMASGNLRPYVAGGGTVGHLQRARVAAADGTMDEDAKEFFKDWDFGLTVGGGLEFGDRTRGFVEGRYTWGLANVAESEEGEAFSLKNRGWQLLAGLTFGF